jgi:hypothetical protein
MSWPTRANRSSTKQRIRRTLDSSSMRAQTRDIVIAFTRHAMRLFEIDIGTTPLPLLVFLRVGSMYSNH